MMPQSLCFDKHLVGNKRVIFGKAMPAAHWKQMKRNKIIRTYSCDLVLIDEMVV
jgi:hypothetical protein